MGAGVIAAGWAATALGLRLALRRRRAAGGASWEEAPSEGKASGSEELLPQ